MTIVEVQGSKVKRQHDFEVQLFMWAVGQMVMMDGYLPNVTSVGSWD
jgi:hypothetical protein